MSSKEYAAPLRLRPGWPWRLFALMCFVGIGTLLLLMVAPLPVPAVAASALWLGVWGGLAGWRYLGPGRIVEAVWKGEGEWLLRQHSGREVSARLASDTFFRPWLVVLNFKAHFRVPALVLFAGEPDERTHRRLRVRLRLYQTRAEDESAEGFVTRASRLVSGRSNWQE